MSESVGWPRKFADWLVGDEPNEQGEWRGFCPMHEDPSTSHTPSASFNFTKGTWKCFSGCRSSTISSLWKKVKDGEVGTGADPDPEGNVVDIKTKAKRSDKPLPSDMELNGWHERLMDTPARLKPMLEERGLTRDILQRYTIGWDGSRYTIPVYDEQGVLKNVRRYKLGAEPSQKMFNWPGHGSPARLFLPEVLRGDEVVLVEGEMDALIGQRHGLPTLSHTAGAGTWRDEDWSDKFRDKEVFVCYDLDSAGRSGARKVANRLKHYAKAIFLVMLDINVKGGDLTDYFVGQGRNASDFQALMRDARLRPIVLRGRAGEPNQAPKKVSLEDSLDAGLNAQPLELTVTIAGKQQPSYTLPKTIDYTCDMSAGDKCEVCPMQVRDGTHNENIGPWDPVLLKMIGVKDAEKDDVLRRVAGAQKCGQLEKDVTESWSVEELLVTPSVEHRGEELQSPISRRAFNVGMHDTPINTTARMVAVSVPDPKDQHAILQSWECEPIQTNLDQFELSEEMHDRIKIFRPDRGQSVMDKMEEIADDLAANVTHIVGRPELHLAYDAVWHSVVDFSFQGNRLGKGWLELVVIGDTRTGKSECALQLSRHYQAGVLKSCEGATFAGLVGGVQQIGGKHWMTTWGVIPLQDRRLVILDEFSGIADKGVIEQMSAIRSSGKAQLTKIQTDETSARTRLIWIANPLDGKPLAELHQPGISALQTLIKNPEDIARFDLAMSAASSDVDSRLINTTHHDEVEHVYTSDVCSALVLWAWSRKADQIRFRPGVEDVIVERANELGGRYVPEPPLVQVENVRVKIARIAVAVAARTFSSDKTGQNVIVRMEHVEAALALMDRLYGMKSFAYMNSSRRILAARKKAKEAREQCLQYLYLHRDDVAATLLAVRNNTGFKLQDFGIFGGMENSDAQAALKALTKMGMVRGMSHGKLKIEPSLMAILQDIEDEEDRNG